MVLIFLQLWFVLTDKKWLIPILYEYLIILWLNVNLIISRIVPKDINGIKLIFVVILAKYSMYSPTAPYIQVIQWSKCIIYSWVEWVYEELLKCDINDFKLVQTSAGKCLEFIGLEPGLQHAHDSEFKIPPQVSASEQSLKNYEKWFAEMPTEVTQSDEDHEAAEVTALNSEDDLERSRFRTQNIPGQSNGLKLYFRLRSIKENDGHEMVFKSSGLRIQVLRNGDPAEPDLYGINIPTSLRGFISLNERREVSISIRNPRTWVPNKYFRHLLHPHMDFVWMKKFPRCFISIASQSLPVW